VNDVLQRVLLNPGIQVSMVLSGVAYGWIFLWALNIRDCVRLWLVAVVPGLLFQLLVFAIRWIQAGSAAEFYLYLAIDWLVFANVAYLTVLARRKHHR